MTDGFTFLLAVTRSKPFAIVHYNTTSRSSIEDPTLSLLLVCEYDTSRYSAVQFHLQPLATARRHVLAVAQSSGSDRLWAMLLLGLPWHSHSFRNSVDALGAPKLFGFNAKQFRWCFDRHIH